MIVGIPSAALGGLIGLLGSSQSVDPKAIHDEARERALADVDSLVEP